MVVRYVCVCVLLLLFCRKFSVKVDRGFKAIMSQTIQKDLLTLEEQEVRAQSDTLTHSVTQCCTPQYIAI